MKEQFIDKRFTATSTARLALVDEILAEYKSQGYDLTLRQLYYQLVSRDYIENSAKSYKRLGNLINDARLAGLVDWNQIVDRSRSAALNEHWETPESIIRSAAYSFAINKWKEQPNHIEVMVEKDALSGVLWPVCSDLDIHFTANKGYPSASLLYRMSKRIISQARAGKDIIVLHLGDHDPSGIDMTRDLVDRLQLLTGQAMNVERLALNMDQVEQYDPPENPAKITDSRYEAYVYEYGDASWELDALEPRVLEELVTTFVTRHRDAALWAKAEAKEARMQTELFEFADTYGKDSDDE